MSPHTPAHRTFRLALIAAAAVALSACSKNAPDTPAANDPAATTPTQVAAAPQAAPAPVAATPAPPVVVAQNGTSAYEQGRRDQERRDSRRNEAERTPPPRADRDQEVDPRYNHDTQVAAAVCRECGVVEAVNAVKVEGKTNGTGAVAGGLGGALVGNRIAGGGNRTLGGVVGAVGGGLLGNAIEKHERTTTVYDVNVRMSDGSLRTVRESTAPALGEKVRVDADGLHDRS
jgi:outer membrane lipoprotein SlyB